MDISRDKLVFLILIFFSASAIIAYIVISFTIPFKDRLFQSLYPKAVSEAAQLQRPDTLEFTSPKGLYKLTYDPRYWTHHTVGSKVIFDLNKEYGFARLDIIAGESDKDLDVLKDEIIQGYTETLVSIEPVQFQGKASLLINYKEEVLGENVYFSRQIVKDNNNFFIFEKRVPQLQSSQNHIDSLLQSFQTVNSKSSSLEVRGVMADSSKQLSTVQLIDLIRPSVASIVYVYCLQVNNLQAALNGFSKPQYNICGLSKGSGFVVNEKGILATNGHVVKVYPEESLVTNLLNEGTKNFATDLIKSTYLSKKQTATPSQIEDLYLKLNSNPQYIDRFLTEIFKLLEQKVISISMINENYFVNLGDEPVKIDYQKLASGDYLNALTPSSTTYSARLVDVNYPNRYSYGAIVNRQYVRGADIALVEISNASGALFPALELGNTDNIREGTDIIIVGYPTLVEGAYDPRAAISYKTSTKPTITRGIISAVKQDLTEKVIFQTDASIDHGNSGGPAFESSGQVIGVATFMAESQTGNFNFLREISELKELMQKNNVDNLTGDLTKYWTLGLSEFRNNYHKQAITNFEKVAELNPSHPTVKDFTKRSQDAIAKGENLEGFAGFLKSNQVLTSLLVVFGVMFAVGLIIGVTQKTQKTIDRLNTKS